MSTHSKPLLGKMKLFSFRGLFIIQMICWSFKAIGQPVSTKTFFMNVGAIAGPSWSFLHGAPSVDNGPNSTRSIKHGFILGLAGTHQISDRINLDIIALYELKGSKLYTIGTQTPVSMDFQYHYVTLPLTLNYEWGARHRFSTGLGVFGGYLFKQVQTESQSVVGSVFTTDVTGQSKALDFGLTAQVKYLNKIKGGWTLTPRLLWELGLQNTGINLYPGLGIYTNTTSVSIEFSKQSK